MTGMCIAETLKAERERRGITQASLAARVGVTQGSISKYEMRERIIPDDVALAAAKALRSPRLYAEFVHERRSEYFNSPLLDNVDDHLILGLDVLAEELEEATAAAKHNAKLLRNKGGDGDMDRRSWELVMENEMQIVDLYAALKLHLVRMEETFERFSVRDLERRHYGKLKMKHYVR